MPPAFDAAHLAALHEALLSWFAVAGRDLPWRRRRSAYGTWISEMMLQQTTVAAVVPYWERFLARFPDVAALAAADESEVLALWSGLGYYRRARMLHAAARRIVADDGGVLPADRARWRSLPGIGDYAAGAIASIALGEAVPAVDANVRRVLTRWAAAGGDEAARLTPARLQDMAAALVPASAPGPWNEALMELGATVCRAREASCRACPVLDWCAAGLAGTAAEVPPARVRPAPVRVAVGLVVARRGREVLLLPPGAPAAVAVPASGAPERDDLGGLHRGLWALPGTPWYAEPADPAHWRRRLVGACTAWAGSAAAGPPVLVGRISHAITRFRLAVDVVEVPVAAHADPADLGGEGAVFARQGDPRPLSKLVVKVIAASGHGSG
ncbi:MAG TPA: A/G-specific adenine glycosylase [Candidatus Krumholzibacteria bacterium]|nr:A/G-specific adenine glycosylase [Candidatus Krumholzibacteria bacterium]